MSEDKYDFEIGDEVACTLPRDTKVTWYKVTKVVNDELEVQHPTYGYSYIEIEMVEQHKKAEEKDDAHSKSD